METKEKIDFEAIIEDIRCGQVIPIIGDEVIYVVTEDVNEQGEAVRKRISLQEFIVGQLNAMTNMNLTYSFKNMTMFERTIVKDKIVRNKKRRVAQRNHKYSLKSKN